MGLLFDAKFGPNQ